MVTRSLVFVLALFVVCTADRAKGNDREDGVWATFDVGGSRMELLVTEPAAIRYVRAFAEGKEASRRFCSTEPEIVRAHLKEWLTARDERCAHSARVVRVSECREGQCTALKGIYAGRSPAF